MKSDKSPNIIRQVSYKESVLCKVAACSLILFFSINSIAYGLDIDTFDRIRARESSLKDAVEDRFEDREGAILKFTEPLAAPDTSYEMTDRAAIDPAEEITDRQGIDPRSMIDKLLLRLRKKRPLPEVAYWTAQEYLKRYGESPEALSNKLRDIWIALNPEREDTSLKNDFLQAIMTDRLFLAVLPLSDQKEGVEIAGFSIHRINTRNYIEPRLIAVQNKFQGGGIGSALMSLSLMKYWNEVNRSFYVDAEKYAAPMWESFFRHRKGSISWRIDRGGGWKYYGTLLKEIDTPPLKTASVESKEDTDRQGIDPKECLVSPLPKDDHAPEYSYGRVLRKPRRKVENLARKDKTGVRFFDARFSMYRPQKGSFFLTFQRPTRKIVLACRVGEGIMREIEEADPDALEIFETNIRVNQIDHVPGALAYATLYVADDILFVSSIASITYSKMIAAKRQYEEKEERHNPVYDKYLNEYRDWAKVTLLAVHDYARSLGYIKRICIGREEFQKASAMANPPGTIPGETMLRRVYHDIPYDFMYAFVGRDETEVLPEYIFPSIDDIPCTIYATNELTNPVPTREEADDPIYERERAFVALTEEPQPPEITDRQGIDPNEVTVQGGDFIIPNMIDELMSMIDMGTIIFGEDEWPKFMYAKIADPDTAFFGRVARNKSGEIVGAVMWTGMGRQPKKILRIIVRDDYLGKGVENILAGSMKLEVMSGAWIRIFAFIREDDKESLKLLQGFGFEASRGRPIVEYIYDDVDAIVMVFPPDAAPSNTDRQGIDPKDETSPIAYEWKVDSDKLSPGNLICSLTSVKNEKVIGSIKLYIEPRGIVVYSCTGLAINSEEERNKGYGTQLVLEGFRRAFKEAHRADLMPRWAYIYYTISAQIDEARMKSFDEFIRGKIGFKWYADTKGDDALDGLYHDYPGLSKIMGPFGAWCLPLDTLLKPADKPEDSLKERTDRQGIDPQDATIPVTSKEAQETLTQDAMTLFDMHNHGLTEEFIEGRIYDLTVSKDWKMQYPKQYKMIEEWWNALKRIFPSCDFEDKIRSNGNGDFVTVRSRILPKDEYDRKDGRRINGKIDIGSSSVKLTGSKDIGHRIFKVLNIAFAASNIPDDINSWNDNARELVEFINTQHMSLTGSRELWIDTEESLERIIKRKQRIKIYLPPIQRQDFNLREELLMAQEALKAV